MASLSGAQRARTIPTWSLIAGTGALLVLLRRRIGRIDFSSILGSFLRVGAAALIFAGAAYGIWRPLDMAFGRSFPAQLVSVGAAFVVGMAVYLFSARLLGVRELETLLAFRRRRRAS